MKKQIMLLALLATIATVYPNTDETFCSYDYRAITSDGAITSGYIYKVSSLLSVAAIASAFNDGDNSATRILAYAATSGFFLAPLINMRKEEKFVSKVKRGVMGCASSVAFFESFSVLLKKFNPPLELSIDVSLGVAADIIRGATK